MHNTLWYHEINLESHAWWIPKHIYESSEQYCVESEYFQRLLQEPESDFQRQILKMPFPNNSYWQNSKFFALHATKHYLIENPLARLLYLRNALGPLWLWHIRSDVDDLRWWQTQLDISNPVYHFLVASTVASTENKDYITPHLKHDIVIELTKKLWSAKIQKHAHTSFWWLGHLPVIYSKCPELLNDIKHQQMMYCAYRMLHVQTNIYHPEYPCFRDAVKALLEKTNKQRLRDLLPDIRIGHKILSPEQIWDSLLTVKTGVDWLKRLSRH